MQNRRMWPTWKTDKAYKGPRSIAAAATLQIIRRLNDLWLFKATETVRICIIACVYESVTLPKNLAMMQCSKAGASIWFENWVYHGSCLVWKLGKSLVNCLKTRVSWVLYKFKRRRHIAQVWWYDTGKFLYIQRIIGLKSHHFLKVFSSYIPVHYKIR